MQGNFIQEGISLLRSGEGLEQTRFREGRCTTWGRWLRYSNSHRMHAANKAKSNFKATHLTRGYAARALNIRMGRQTP